MDATHFIEVFKSKERPWLIHSPEPQPIKFLETALNVTSSSSTLKTIAVWKIKPKSSDTS